MAIQHRDKYCRCYNCKAKRIQEKKDQRYRVLRRKYLADRKNQLEMKKRAEREAIRKQKSRIRTMNKVEGFFKKAVFGFDKKVVKPASKSFVSAGDSVFYRKRKKVFKRRRFG